MCVCRLFLCMCVCVVCAYVFMCVCVCEPMCICECSMCMCFHVCVCVCVCPCRADWRTEAGHNTWLIWWVSELYRTDWRRYWYWRCYWYWRRYWYSPVYHIFGTTPTYNFTHASCLHHNCCHIIPTHSFTHTLLFTTQITSTHLISHIYCYSLHVYTKLHKHTHTMT